MSASSSHSSDAVQCLGHMQLVASVIERLHNHSIDAFAARRDDTIRALDVPLLRWPHSVNPACDGGSVDGDPLLIGLLLGDVHTRWQQLTERGEHELDAAVSGCSSLAFTAGTRQDALNSCVLSTACVILSNDRRIFCAL